MQAIHPHSCCFAQCEWDGDITKTVQVQVLPSERAYLERLVEDAEDKYGGF